MHRNVWYGLVVIVIVAVGFMTFWLPKDPPTPAELRAKQIKAWQHTMIQNCHARKGKVAWKGATAECWRTPFMREPVLQFSETFGEQRKEAKAEGKWTNFRFRF